MALRADGGLEIKGLPEGAPLPSILPKGSFELSVKRARPDLHRHLLSGAGAHHHGRRVLEGEHFDDRRPALQHRRPAPRSGVHALLLRHQSGRVLGRDRLRLARHQYRLVGGLRRGRRRHGARLHRLRLRQAVARRQRRAARSGADQAAVLGADQFGMVHLSVRHRRRRARLADRAAERMGRLHAGRGLGRRAELSARLHVDAVHLRGGAAHDLGVDPDRRVGRVLDLVRAGGLVDQSVHRAQHDVDRRRAVDHGGADAIVQRRIHLADGAGVLGLVGLSRAVRSRSQSGA